MNGLFCDCTKVEGNEEPIANAGVKDCPAADSDPFGAPRAPDNDGVPVIDVAGKEELPNVQYVEINEGTLILPVAEGKGRYGALEVVDAVTEAEFPANGLALVVERETNDGNEGDE